MFIMYATADAVPVRVTGFAYGVALALPPFLGEGHFRPDDACDHDPDAERWEADGGALMNLED